MISKILQFESKVKEQLQIIQEEKVPVAIFAMDDNSKFIDKIYAQEIKVITMVTSATICNYRG